MDSQINNLPLNVFLLGDPAAGKATQAFYLVKKFPLYDLDMGKELRILKKKDKKIQALLKNTYDKGNLTQTNLVRNLHKQKIFSTPKNLGILFDGTPKMLGEAKLIEKWLEQTGRKRGAFIYLSIPIGETIKRMQNRREYFKGKFSRRSDDTTQALENRVKYYRKNIQAVVKFFKHYYPYKKISGLGTREEVRQNIQKFIEKQI